MTSFFEEKCEKLKIIVSEVDGIITDGLINYDELQNVVFKSYEAKDFEAINRLKKHFIFVFLSKDSAISYNLFRRKNIPFFYNKRRKLEELNKIMRKYSVTPEEVMYVGYSYSDVECVKMIPFSVCPSDAVSEVYDRSYCQLKSFSGSGVLCEVYEILKPEILKRRRKKDLTNQN